MKKFFLTIGRITAVFFLCAVTVLACFSISPIFDFEKPRPFAGDDIYNPYSQLDTTLGWKRANFHTHTRVKSVFNECEYWPDQVWKYYSDLGYDIVTFSNHNALTAHPFNPELQVNVYEHGYNLFKFHLLVFGSEGVNHFDPLLPFLTSQRQWILDILGRESDFIQMNHPFRTRFTSKDDMELLTGYRIMELDSDITTEQEYWDWALSAGHYSTALANDDLHHPDLSDHIAVRSNMLNCSDGSYAELKRTLLQGGSYCMRVPDYGNGDYEKKREGIAALPGISEIGAEGDTVYVRFTDAPMLVKAVGQDAEILAAAENSESLRYVFREEDSYVRFTAYFSDGTVIYTNPFARYDKSVSDTPYRTTAHTVNVWLTILWNLLVVLIAGVCVSLIRVIVKRRFKARVSSGKKA